jgi:hypothetical protein
MRGEAERQGTMLRGLSAEHRIAADHPLRRIKAMADAELARRPDPVSRAATRARRRSRRRRLPMPSLLGYMSTTIGVGASIWIPT